MTNLISPSDMKKLLKQSDFYNAWLQPYHGTTIEEIIENEPELCKTREWYTKYAVTQEQHDEWYKWAIDYIAKYYRIGKKRAQHDFAFDYLNIAPSIKKEEL